MRVLKITSDVVRALGISPESLASVFATVICARQILAFNDEELQNELDQWRDLDGDARGEAIAVKGLVSASEIFGGLDEICARAKQRLLSGAGSNMQ